MCACKRWIFLNRTSHLPPGAFILACLTQYDSTYAILIVISR